MDKRKQVQIDDVYMYEVAKLRDSYRKKKIAPPSVPHLINRAIRYGFGALRASVAKDLGT